MRILIIILFSFISISTVAQQPDFKGVATNGTDSFDILIYKRSKPAEPPPAPVATCDRKGIRRYLTPSSDPNWGGFYANAAKDFTCNPGDTLVLKGIWKGGAAIENFHGTASCPIVIINEGNIKLPGGFNLRHCTYVKVTGSGTSTKYGFDVSGNGTGPGLEVTGRSAFIAFERINVYKKAYGAWVKEEANCFDSLQYPNWWIDNISIHDCRFVNIGQDGLYLGSTSPTGQRSIGCNGKIIYPVPLRLSNIRIYNNIVDSCNRTGIQLSGADKGDNRIYNNTVTRCGYELNNTQGDGIALGGMTRAWVHDNYIRQTFKHGMFLIGSGPSKIENNNIDSSGLLGNLRNDFMQPVGIFADSRLTVPANDSVILVIRNNILGKNTQLAGEHIVLFNSNNLFAPGNVISGNTVQGGGAAKLYVAPGIIWTAQ